jgi:hypothetical protein
MKRILAIGASALFMMGGTAIATPSANQVYEQPTTPEGPLPPIPTTPDTPPDDSCCEHNPPVIDNPPKGETPPTVTTPRDSDDTLPVTGLDALLILGAAGGAGLVGFALRRKSGR